MPLAYNPTKNDGRSVAINNDLKVLKALRLFGHLRRQEFALAVWPNSSPKSAYIMACRTIKRLTDDGLVLMKQNTLGGISVVLAAKGVSRLRDEDLTSLEGYDLAFDGPQFFHRTLGTCYLLEKARTGCEVFGEYALLKELAPVAKDFLKLKYNKMPDGLIVYGADALGYKGGLRGADWIEVESAYKPYDELRKALNLLTKNAELNVEGSLILNKLVFVFDGRQKHDRPILRAIKQFLKERPDLSPEIILKEIILAKCTIGPPFVWHGVVEFTAEDLFKNPSFSLEGPDRSEM